MENLILDNIQFNRQTIYPINEELFWQMVDQTNWYELCKEHGKKSTELFSKYLIKRYDIDQISELQRIEVEKRDEVLDIIRDYLENASDESQKEYKLDSLDSIDLASYIVGLGRTMYYYIKDNPSMILDLQNRNIACFEDGFDKAIYAINFVD